MKLMHIGVFIILGFFSLHASAIPVPFVPKTIMDAIPMIVGSAGSSTKQCIRNGKLSSDLDDGPCASGNYSSGGATFDPFGALQVGGDADLGSINVDASELSKFSSTTVTSCPAGTLDFGTCTNEIDLSKMDEAKEEVTTKANTAGQLAIELEKELDELNENIAQLEDEVQQLENEINTSSTVVLQLTEQKDDAAELLEQKKKELAAANAEKAAFEQSIRNQIADLEGEIESLRPTAEKSCPCSGFACSGTLYCQIDRSLARAQIDDLNDQVAVLEAQLNSSNLSLTASNLSVTVWNLGNSLDSTQEQIEVTNQDIAEAEAQRQALENEKSTATGEQAELEAQLAQAREEEATALEALSVLDYVDNTPVFTSLDFNLNGLDLEFNMSAFSPLGEDFWYLFDFDGDNAYDITYLVSGVDTTQDVLFSGLITYDYYDTYNAEFTVATADLVFRNTLNVDITTTPPDINATTNPVSEPSAIALMGMGLLGFGIYRRRVQSSTTIG